MRIRTIKPEFWTSLTVTSLPVNVRLTFIGLWNLADDEGRGLAEPRLVKAALWPLDDDVDPVAVALHLQALSATDLITLYADDQGKPLFSVNSWKEHQSISKPSPSRFPEPSDKTPVSLPEDSSRERNREQGTGKGTGNRIAPRATRQESSGRRAELFEALAEVCGIDWTNGALTDDERAVLNKKAAVLDRVGATADEIRRRATNWPSLFERDTTLTPGALVKWWGQLSQVRTPHSKTTSTGAALAAQLEAEGR